MYSTKNNSLFSRRPDRKSDFKNKLKSLDQAMIIFALENNTNAELYVDIGLDLQDEDGKFNYLFPYSIPGNCLFEFTAEMLKKSSNLNNILPVGILHIKVNLPSVIKGEKEKLCLFVQGGSLGQKYLVSNSMIEKVGEDLNFIENQEPQISSVSL